MAFIKPKIRTQLGAIGGGRCAFCPIPTIGVEAIETGRHVGYPGRILGEWHDFAIALTGRTAGRMSLSI